jgi:ubiquinone/menaquinone biosynthesis C-methylase UbiE
MNNEAEERVSNFYNSVGWEVAEKITEDARLWEDLRTHANAYVRKCRLRVMRYIPLSGNLMLDMASGPIQYDEYVAYSRSFQLRYCIDLSAAALEQAKRKIGDRGVFLHGSFFDLTFDENSFDCAISLHTIYHIDRDRQEEAVRKLLRVTKPGQPVIIVYSNPAALVARLRSSLFGRIWRRAISLLGTPHKPTAENIAGSLYFYSHPVGWWKRFEDSATVQLRPWRMFDADTQKKVIPDNRLGAFILRLLFAMEDRFPALFVKYGQYPMIILTKR